MNYVLAVCDSETEYAYQLVDYLSNKKGFPFQVQLFTSGKTFRSTSPNLLHPRNIPQLQADNWSDKIHHNLEYQIPEEEPPTQLFWT